MWCGLNRATLSMMSSGEGGRLLHHHVLLRGYSNLVKVSACPFVLWLSSVVGSSKYHMGQSDRIGGCIRGHPSRTTSAVSKAPAISKSMGHSRFPGIAVKGYSFRQVRALESAALPFLS